MPGKIKEYRIISDERIENGIVHYFPQVRTKIKFIFGFKYYTQWKRIGQHTYGFGLYDYLSYPQTYDECAVIIHKYTKWIEGEALIKVAHSYQ